MNLPAPIPGPRSTEELFGKRHNATPYEQALGIARDMRRRHHSGDYNTAADFQSRSTIYTLLSREAAEAMLAVEG